MRDRFRVDELRAAAFYGILRELQNTCDESQTPALKEVFAGLEKAFLRLLEEAEDGTEPHFSRN